MAKKVNQPKVVIKKRKKKVIIRKKAKSPSVIEIEDVYKHINKVQLDRVSLKFKVETNDMCVVDNLLRDTNLPFTKNVKEEVVIYSVDPGPERDMMPSVLEDLEELDDEILEDGQCFD